MKNRNQRVPEIKKRKNHLKWLRFPLLALFLASCVAGASLGGLLPSEQ